MTNPTQFLAREQWRLAPPPWSSGTVGTGQTPEFAIVVNAIMAQEDLDKPVTLWVSLEKSRVSPGALQDNKDDTVGYYQDRVDVTMTLCRAGSNDRVDYFRIVDVGPDTYNGSGNVSNSVSVSVSGNIGGGFFSSMATGNVGVGVGAGNTHSFGETVLDFEILNDSDAYVCRHTYFMAKSDGDAYSKPEDLVPGVSWGSLFDPIKLHKPVPLAMHDLTLLSQCVWQADGDKSIKVPHAVNISVRQHLVWVTASNQIVRHPGQSLTALGTWDYTLDVPLQKLDVKTL
jgi:hypothetical protein